MCSHIRGARFPPPSPRGGILSLRGGERIPRVPVASQVEALARVQPRWIQGIRRVDGVGVERLVCLLM